MRGPTQGLPDDGHDLAHGQGRFVTVVVPLDAGSQTTQGPADRTNQIADVGRRLGIPARPKQDEIPGMDLPDQMIHVGAIALAIDN